MKVCLYTSDGGDLVRAQEIPAFNQAPDVLFWGERTFKYFASHRREVDGQAEHNYKEAFCYTITGTP